MQKKKKSKRALHLLEIMLAIGILAIAGGAIFWRLDRFIQHKRFQGDTGRLKSTLLHAKTLALNTHSDIQVVLASSKKGWNIQLQCQEDPTAVPHKWHTSLGPSQLFLNDVSVKELKFEFFSSGHTLPKGTLKFQAKDQTSLISLSELFRQSL
jgi:Tfp pilus assembly protein FimT